MMLKKLPLIFTTLIFVACAPSGQEKLRITKGERFTEKGTSSSTPLSHIKVDNNGQKVNANAKTFLKMP